MAGLVGLEIRNAWVNSSTGVLGSDSTLVSTLGAAVYQRVPENASYPYVVVGNSTEVPDQTYGDKGREVTITVHCWDDTPTDDDCHKIADRVTELLDCATFSLATYTLTYSLLESAVEVPEEHFLHIAVTFRVRVSESA